jgi:hypothetical protein
MTGCKLGPRANIDTSKQKILRSVYERINQSDCENWVNFMLSKLGAKKDRDTLDELINIATLSMWDEDLSTAEMGISAEAHITLVNFFNNEGKPMATAGDQVFMVPLAFKRNRVTVPGMNNWDYDTATFLVHELFHVAGFLDEKQVTDMNKAIHDHCGFKGMAY